VLKLEKINASYGYLQILWDVSMEINKGEVVALLGSNGVGKTTTLKVISGLKKPTSGKVSFDGEDVVGLSADQLCTKGLAFIPEERNLFNAMSVFENLIMGAFTIKDKHVVQKNLEYVYGLFPRLEERKKQLVGTMSGGERQMVAVARGLMSNPKLIMLDEPSMGLSPQNTLIVFDALKKLKGQGVTVLIVEQNVNTTLQFADRAYVMDQGRVLMSGTSRELLSDDRIQRMYMGI
jgi:branched-chain amino acid transport system ATP-binding protein